MVKREVVIINNKEYSFGQIGVFEKSELFAKIQAIVLPALKNVKFDGNSGADTALAMFAAISPCITEKELNDIVIPMLRLSQSASMEDNCKIDSKVAINKCFDDMDDFFTFVFEVAKYNFLPSIKRLMANFGVSDGSQKATE